MVIYLLFALGFIILIFGANWLVKGASSLGHKLGMPNIVIGLTIVSLGTSAPELIISLLASMQGNTDLAVANVLGSNIFNTLMIVGVAAMLLPINIKKNTLYKELPYSFLSAIVVGMLAIFSFGWDKKNNINTLDGIILLVFFGLFMLYTFSLSKRSPKEKDFSEKKLQVWKSVIFIIIGVSGLFFGGKLIVDSAIKIAPAFGMSEALIGITIVATATSLPELVTSAVAALKHNSDIAIGNALGSNIFNIFLVLGLSALLNDLSFNMSELGPSLLVAIVSNIILFVFIVLHKKHKILRWEGLILVVIYFVFVYYSVQGIK